MAIRRFKVTPTISTSQYAANEVVGSLLTFSGILSGTLQSITICDNAGLSVDYFIVLFDSAPTSINDNATYDLEDRDLDKIIYQDSLAASATRQGFHDNAYSYIYGRSVPIQTTTGKLYAFLITTGTPTYAATDDITVTLQIKDFDTVRNFEV